MPRKAREPAPLPTLRQSGSLEAAMEAFRADVHTAAEMYVDEKEQGKRAAIEAVIRLLFDLQPEAAIWRRPFVAIAQELDHASRGGRPWREWEIKAVSAATVDVLFSMGIDEQTASEAVSGVLHEHKLAFGKARSEKPAWESVKELRESLLKRRGPPKAIDYFDDRRGEFSKFLDALDRPIEVKREIALGMFRDYLAKLKGK
jgi:hypothetical protein